MQKIKRTDVKKRGGFKAFFKAMLITFAFIVLFAIGFFAASYFARIL